MNVLTKSKQSQARAWVNGYAVAGTAVVVAAIIPGSTSAALMGMEIHMCYKIGKIYRGDQYTMQEATAAARVVGLVAIAAQILALEAVNVIPFAGWVVKASIAGAIIKSLGEAIIKHYEKLEAQECPPAIIDVQATTPPPLPTPSVEHQLRRLKDMLQNRIISQAEHDQQRQRILSQL